MKISFHGAARNVTGSKHLITLNNGTKILLDCGMFQGMGQETEELNENFGFNPAEVDLLVLSHAHIDHSGLIPRLVAQGFKGKIYGTSATRELAKILLLDSAKIQAGDLKYKNKKLAKRGLPLEEALYEEADALKAISLFEVVPYHKEIVIAEGVTLQFFDAGHIIGSASVYLQITENGNTTSLSFSGDVGQYGDLLLRAPQPFPQADYILLESTYGDKLHKDAQPTAKALLDVVVKTCVEKKGKVIIPAFSVGRTQEILHVLSNLDLEDRLPKVNVYVDSPLSAKATAIVENHAEGFNNEVLDIMKIDDNPFDFEHLHYVESAEESIALNANPEPCIIISASGMAEAGRVKHHIKNCIGHAKNTILLVGYCEPNSLGGRLKNGAKEVGIFGDRFEVQAEVQSIQSMSAHGDYNDLLQFLSGQDASKVKKIFLVHGEYEVQQVFKEKLHAAGFANVEIPDRHQAFELSF
ncbi:MBL fold metallo-hydrolase RNA specificity domain-containing protein [Pedobacter sp. SL55]|uniref:MBL fold metallo-hydrolase RNA specificity domain-containing protein n=1 Tax=Pedobacter sp. SL55 TaxID=2995161 RepID=UPI00226E7964|nr:MBL fold metallo-hydrolase [Pedobacter sp. SL55]WAC41555.1 MBL fold metallo-hydrolase [Pedobacter sp. SL55]